MIIRAQKNTNYTVINNTVLEDQRLSWRARGIAAYLLSKPDNWRIDHKHLWKAGKEGRDAVLTALKELEEAGYLHRVRRQDEDGKFSTEVVLYEEPRPSTDFQEPSTDFQDSVQRPSTENQNSENQNSVFQDSLQVLKTSTERVAATATADSAVTEVFDVWRRNMAGVMTEIIRDGILDLLDDYSQAEVLQAIKIACERNKRTLGYVRGILQKGVDVPVPSSAAPKQKQYIIDPITGERQEVYA